MRAVSYVVGTILALVAVLLGAYGVLGTLYGEVAIVGIGILLLVLPFAIAARWAFTRSAHPRGWGILALVAFGAAVALQTFGPRFTAAVPPIVALRIALACLAVGAAIAAVRDWRAAHTKNWRPLH